mmetsp:Transcript_66528/g.216472  ORF Transcript_66528/g.216472 Transcript_66528/m.216472 type:complete len:206 (+) Transcript_66528:882-1499(+)
MQKFQRQHLTWSTPCRLHNPWSLLMRSPRAGFPLRSRPGAPGAVRHSNASNNTPAGHTPTAAASADAAGAVELSGSCEPSPGCAVSSKLANAQKTAPPSPAPLPQQMVPQRAAESIARRQAEWLRDGSSHRVATSSARTRGMSLQQFDGWYKVRTQPPSASLSSDKPKQLCSSWLCFTGEKKQQSKRCLSSGALSQHRNGSDLAM